MRISYPPCLSRFPRLSLPFRYLFFPRLTGWLRMVHFPFRGCLRSLCDSLSQANDLKLRDEHGKSARDCLYRRAYTKTPIPISPRYCLCSPAETQPSNDIARGTVSQAHRLSLIPVIVIESPVIQLSSNLTALVGPLGGFV
jgi:hypothetical protein